MEDDLPSEYDVIVIGTGLVESVVAAAAARIGKKVLHLDRNSSYGQLWSTFNLENFEEFLINIDKNNEKKFTLQSPKTQYTYYETVTQEIQLTDIKSDWYILDKPEPTPEDNGPTEDEDTDKKEETLKQIAEEPVKKETVFTRFELTKISQKFNIDLSPKIIYSKGKMVETLIRSGVSRYTEFINVHNILLYLNAIIEAVPYSKADIFSTRSVSVVEKRILMKLLQEIQNFKLDSIENEDCKNNESFHDFLRNFKISELLEKYILYSIARVSSSAPCIDGIKSAQYFLNSLGIYGNSPFLWPLYGSSELVQAFCRLCAVYGGIYCLNRGVESVIVENNKCVGILSKEKELIADHIVMSSSQTPVQFFLNHNNMESMSRGILLTNKSIYPAGKKGASVLQIPSEDSSSPPFTLIELDNSTLSCPNDLYLVHLIKENNGNDYHEFDKLINELYETFEETKDNDESIQKPKILYKAYFNMFQIKSESSNLKPNNFHICNGPVGTELDFFSALEEAENIFKKMYPEEVFLPPPVETSSADE